MIDILSDSYCRMMRVSEIRTKLKTGHLSKITVNTWVSMEFSRGD